MTRATPEQAAAIQGLTALAEALYAALDHGNPQQILAAQQDLSAAAEVVWARAQGDASISRQGKALLRVLAGAALEDLPAEIQDPANYGKVKKQLRLLKSSLVLTGILPWLTPLAAVGLALIQLLAIFTEHLPNKETHELPVNVVLLMLAVFVAVGRFMLA